MALAENDCENHRHTPHTAIYIAIARRFQPKSNRKMVRKQNGLRREKKERREHGTVTQARVRTQTQTHTVSLMI